MKPPLLLGCNLFAIMQILIENHWKVRKCKLLILLANFHYRARKSPKIKKSKIRVTKNLACKAQKSMHLSSFIELYLAHIVTAQMLFDCWTVHLKGCLFFNKGKACFWNIEKKRIKEVQRWKKKCKKDLAQKRGVPLFFREVLVTLSNAEPCWEKKKVSGWKKHSFTGAKSCLA